MPSSTDWCALCQLPQVDVCQVPLVGVNVSSTQVPLVGVLCQLPQVDVCQVPMVGVNVSSSTGWCAVSTSTG